MIYLKLYMYMSFPFNFKNYDSRTQNKVLPWVTMLFSVTISFFFLLSFHSVFHVNNHPTSSCYCYFSQNASLLCWPRNLVQSPISTAFHLKAMEIITVQSLPLSWTEDQSPTLLNSVLRNENNFSIALMWVMWVKTV